MKIERIISTVDLHTAGEPVRLILRGVPFIPGNTMEEKQKFFSQELDFVRTTVLHEPRGHRDMCGCMITPPMSQKAHFGLIFFDVEGYLDMCGHSTIGVATAVLELGMFAKEEPETPLIIDTPAGLVNVNVRIEEGNVRNVTMRNVASFLLTQDHEIELPEIGRVKVDIAFGGNFFALVDVADLNLSLEIEHLDRLIVAGLKIREIANAKLKVRHPRSKHISGISLTEIYGEAKNPKANARNVVIFGKGQVDRSPCGTGTSAKLASLYAKKEIELNEPFIYESIIGTLFEGKIVGVTKIGRFEAVIPEIKGSAYITGFNQYIVDSEDPLKHGFLI